jgi:hypothetical protein
MARFAASVFGEQRRLEPMSAETRARWNKEIDWLLSVTGHIVEFAPSHQVAEDGTNMEVSRKTIRTFFFLSILRLHLQLTAFRPCSQPGDGYSAAPGSSHEHPCFAKTRCNASGRHGYIYPSALVFLGVRYAFEQISEIQFVWCYLL